MRYILTLLLFTVAVSAGNGKLDLNNENPSGAIEIGTFTPGSDYMFELRYDSDYISGGDMKSSGYFNFGRKNLNQFNAGEEVIFDIKLWKKSLGSTWEAAESNAVLWSDHLSTEQAFTLGSGNNIPNMVDITSAIWAPSIPEPSPFAYMVIGCMIMAMWFSRKR